MRLERKCKCCGEKFFATKEKQFFCSRACFKREYYLNKRNQKKISPIASKRCPSCGKVNELSFEPSKDHVAFDRYKCKTCFPKERNNISIIVSDALTLVFF